MNPLINLILIIPAGLLLITIYLMRVKSVLEDLIYRYRQEGIILQTSLTIIALSIANESWKKTLGMVLFTRHRVIAYDWRKRIVFNNEFDADVKKKMIIKKVNNKQIIVQHEPQDENKKLRVNVRNPDAWVFEYTNLSSTGTLNQK